MNIKTIITIILLLSVSVQADTWKANNTTFVLDNRLDATNSTTNHAADTIGFCGEFFSTNKNRIVFMCVSFQDSIGATSNITKCTLAVYCPGGSFNGDFDLHEIKRLNTSESGSTWDNYKSGTSWQTAGAEGANDYNSTYMTRVNVGGAGNWFYWEIDTSVANAALASDTLATILRVVAGANALMQFSLSEANANQPEFRFTFDVASTSADYRHSPDGVGVRHDPSGTPTARHRP